MNLSAALLRFRSGSKLIWRGLATRYFSLSHPCLSISPNKHAHGKQAFSWTPRSIWPFERCRRWAACNCLRVYFRGPSPSLFGQNPYIKNRFSTDFNRLQDLRIWVGEMVQSGADCLKYKHMYPGSIFYVSFYIIWTFVMGLLLCRRLWLHILRFTFAEHDRVLNWDGETTPSRQ